jgi:hypothetical protein
VPGAFHGRVPGPVWPAEDSHSPWTDCQGPRHEHNQTHAISYNPDLVFNTQLLDPSNQFFALDSIDKLCKSITPKLLCM